MKKTIVLYLVILFAVLFDRILVLQHYAFKFTGNDDLIYWLGALDYSKGLFYEPYFYGQPYNPMLEALFAVPLLWYGLPVNIALPISTSFIALFPFIFISIVLLRRGLIIESFVFLILPLTLPVDYGVLTSMSRGFVSGLFFCAFMIYPLLYPRVRWTLYLYFFSMILGYFFCPNSLLFSFPVGLYLFFHNYKNLHFYIAAILICIPVFWLEIAAKNFYNVNPLYNLHPEGVLAFYWELLAEAFKMLDQFYSYFTPFIWFAGWLIIPTILIAAIFLFKTERLKAICLIAAVLLIILSLGINKVHVRMNSIFFSGARMYLAIPLFTGLAFLWCRPLIKISDKTLKVTLLILALFTFGIKAAMTPSVVERLTEKKNFEIIAIEEVEKIKCKCDEIAAIAAAKNAELVVFIPNYVHNVPETEFLAWGCAALKKIPHTLMGYYERRSWLYLEEKKKIRKNLLVYGFDLSTIKNLNNGAIISTDPSMILYKNNHLVLDSVLIQLGYNYRRF